MADFITMAGVEHSTASLEIRELFAFTKSAAQTAMRTVLKTPGVTGCVILSTCNRTELWLTTECQVDSAELSKALLWQTAPTQGFPAREAASAALPERLEATAGDMAPTNSLVSARISSGRCPPDAAALLCALRCVEYAGARAFITRREGLEAARHLLETACGLHSRVFGEDQIITQVNTALAAARECGCAGPVLERLFRAAVTAAKRVKTMVCLTARDASAPARAAAVLEREWGGALSGMECLIIGNGQMGRLAAKELLARGCRVGMTLRSHHHGGGGDIPPGCAVVPYEERYAALKAARIVVSATSSPHHTLHYAATLPYLDGTRRVLIDLAVPRDISVRLADAPGVTLYDIDSLAGPDTPRDFAAEQRVEKARAVLEQELTEFEAWLNFRGLDFAVRAAGEAAAQELCLRLEQVLCRLVPAEHRAELETAAYQSAKQITERLAYGMRGLPEDAAEEAVNRVLRAAQKHPAQYAPCGIKRRKL